MDMAVPSAGYGVFSLQGQMCVAASRLYVQSGIYDKFVEAATNFAKNYKVGNPTDASSQNGPQVLHTMTPLIIIIIQTVERTKQDSTKLLGIFF